MGWIQLGSRTQCLLEFNQIHFKICVWNTGWMKQLCNSTLMTDMRVSQCKQFKWSLNFQHMLLTEGVKGWGIRPSLLQQNKQIISLSCRISVLNGSACMDCLHFAKVHKSYLYSAALWKSLPFKWWLVLMSYCCLLSDLHKVELKNDTCFCF